MSDVAAVRRRRSRAVWLAVVGILVLLVAAAAWVGIRAMMAKDELEAALPVADAMKSAVASQDLDALAKSASELERRSARAAELTGDPVWRAFEAVPVLGPNLAAVRIVSSRLADVSVNVVNPLLQLSTSAASAVDGDAPLVSAVADAAAPLARAAEVMTEASSELDDVDTGALLAPVADGVSSFRKVIAQTAPTLRSLADVTRVLPGLLGADAPRTILLMLQNNAELRTGGGITGSFALLSVDAGTLQIVEQLDSSDFAGLAAPQASIPSSTLALYGPAIGDFVQNTTMTADFTLSADLALKWWTEHAGASATAVPDAVISIDPIVLQSLLAHTGPATLADGSEITADKIVQRLLVDPYLMLDPDGQTAFFEEVTSASLAAFEASMGDPLTMLSALAAPAEQGRISIWSADPDEQAILAGTPLAGPAARQSAAGAEAYAVYFNDATGGKMDTFMGTRIAVATAQCRADGRSDVQVTVTLHSTAPADAGDLPMSITGGGRWGTGTGDIGTNVSVSAPPGTFFGGVTIDGEPLVSADVTDGGFSVSMVRLNLQPSEVNVLQFRFIAAEPGEINPTILHTPMTTDPVIEDASLACS